jgi:hypothetical protein
MSHPKLSSEEMIERIVETELDRISLEDIIQYFIDKLRDHYDSKDDEYVEQVFNEMFENDLERVVDEKNDA